MVKQVKKYNKTKKDKANKNKNSNKNLSESNSQKEMITEFPRFIVIESLEETPFGKLYSFLIEKNNLQQNKPSNCKKKN